MLAASRFAAIVVLGFVPSALAQDRSAAGSRIIDEAHLFKREAAEAATKALETAEREYGVPVVIEAVPSLKGTPLEEAARRAAQASGGEGIFIYITRQEHSLRVLTRRALDGRLPAARLKPISDAFLKGFKEGDFDEGLKAGVEETVAILKATAPPEGASPLVVRNRVGLTLAGARKAIAAAEAKAAEMKLKVNIAVVDDGGHLLAFARMDGARPASAATAQTKATSAATMRQPTGPIPAGVTPPDLLVNLGLPGAAAASGEKITTLYGGIPIVVDGQVVGAVGVGGGSGEQDAEVARTGAAAVAHETGERSTAK